MAMPARRTIVLTGVTGKFGLILCQHFLSAGDIVIGTARSQTALHTLENAMRDGTDNFHGVAVDFMTAQSVGQFCDAIASRGIRPDCLVNNARSLDFLSVPEDGVVGRQDFCNEYLMDVVIPYELTMKLALQKRSQLKRVVNIGSQYGVVAVNPNLYDAPDNQSPIQYSVAKAALMHLTKELAVRLARQKIQVNCVAFGGVRGRVDAQFEQRYAGLCPTGRMLDDDDIAGPVDALLSDGNGAITGQTVVADGGWSLW
jgi:NAD(P)-dependent dehydrogenase (short-subunit alcohol dehydrogenase family)